MMYDDDCHPLEADREHRHEIAHDYDTYPSGESLPRHTDKRGRAWVTCTCCSKLLLPAEGKASAGTEDD